MPYKKTQKIEVVLERGIRKEETHDRRTLRMKRTLCTNHKKDEEEKKTLTLLSGSKDI